MATGELQLLIGTAPGTPGAGYITVYSKADKKLYYKDEDGIEHQITVPSISAYIETLLNDADAATARATLGAAALAVAQTFTAPQTADVAALTHNTAWDGAAKQQLTATVNGSSFTIANPTGSTLRPNTYYTLYVTYTTSHTIAFGSNFKGIANISPTGTAGAKDHFIFRADSAGLNLELVSDKYDIGA
jgi:hypothetical protein